MAYKKCTKCGYHMPVDTQESICENCLKQEVVTSDGLTQAEARETLIDAETGLPDDGEPSQPLHPITGEQND